MDKLESLLEQLGLLLNNYNKLAKVTGENFNIFSVMGMENNEVKTHSAIIGELLNPKGSHGLEDIPLKLFIEQIISRLDNSEIVKKFDLDTKNSKSIIEEHAGTINEDKTEGGRIDIVVKDIANRVIVIENKIYAGEQQNQLLRYYMAYPKAPILFLTLDGKPPLSVGKDLKINEHYFLISYRKDILEWLEKCVKEAVKFPMLREVIQQYIYLIKKLTNQTMNDDLKKGIKLLIKNNLLESKEIYRNFLSAKVEIINTFLKEMKECLEIKLGKDSLKINNNLSGVNYHYLTVNIDEDEDFFYYVRYINSELKNDELQFGIMINTNKEYEKKGINGKTIYETLKAGHKLSNVKSGPQSIIFRDADKNFVEIDFLNMINNSDKIKDLVGKYSAEFLEFVSETKSLYEASKKYLYN